MKENKFESYFGRKIAVDASMSIYQFLVCTSFTTLTVVSTTILMHYSYVINVISRVVYWILVQIVVGRSGTEMLTNEAGEVTRYMQ